MKINFKNMASDSEKLIKKIQLIQKLTSLLQNPTRFKILGLLLLKESLSLQSLTQAVNLKKTTVMSHLQKFLDIDFIKKDTFINENSRKENIYQINYSIFTLLNFNFGEVEGLPKEEFHNYFSAAISSIEAIYKLYIFVYEKYLEELHQLQDVLKHADTIDEHTLFYSKIKNFNQFGKITLLSYESFKKIENDLNHMKIHDGIPKKTHLFFASLLPLNFLR